MVGCVAVVVIVVVAVVAVVIVVVVVRVVVIVAAGQRPYVSRQLTEMSRAQPRSLEMSRTRFPASSPGRARATFSCGVMRTENRRFKSFFFHSPLPFL